MQSYRELVPTFADRTDWAMPTVLRERAASHGDRTYLDAPEEGRRWTYAETLAAAERVAGGLISAGMQPGDRLVLLTPNSSTMVFSYLGCALAGGVQVPINTAYRGSFFEHQVRTVEARFAVTTSELAERFLESASACGTVEVVWVLGTEEEVTALRDAASDLHFRIEPADALLAAPPPPAFPEVASTDLASVFFTSGTTGPSKGVMMPHAQMHFFAEEVVSLTRLTDDDTYMTVTPLFHGNAQFMAAYPAMVAGAGLVLRSRFSASRWVDQLRDGGVTVTNFVGVMMDFVYKQPARADDAENPLRCVFAAPTAWSILDDFTARFGVEAFVEVFGLTETSAPILTPYGAQRPPGAAGLEASDWFEVRLVDPETDEEVPVGEVGELVVRPRLPWTCSLGYYGMPEKTAEAWRNLWFHTGDGLRRDEDGWFYFVDRLKDALRRRGENISSYEVEQAILGADAVLECAVIAVPAEFDAGEDEVMAVLVTDGSITPDEVWQLCDRRLPDFTVPRYLRFMDALPKTPSEKVQKAELRALGLEGQVFDRRAHRGGQA